MLNVPTAAEITTEIETVEEEMRARLKALRALLRVAEAQEGTESPANANRTEEQ